MQSDSTKSSWTLWAMFVEWMNECRKYFRLGSRVYFLTVEPSLLLALARLHCPATYARFYPSCQPLGDGCFPWERSGLREWSKEQIVHPGSLLEFLPFLTPLGDTPLCLLPQRGTGSKVPRAASRSCATGLGRPRGSPARPPPTWPARPPRPGEPPPQPPFPAPATAERPAAGRPSSARCRGECRQAAGNPNHARPWRAGHPGRVRHRRTRSPATPLTPLPLRSLRPARGY